MDRSAKVATPFTAFWVNVPLRVPPPGLVPMARVIGAELDTRLLPASRTLTVTAGAMAVAEFSLVGGWEKASLAAGPRTMSVPPTVTLPEPWQLAPRAAWTVKG